MHLIIPYAASQQYGTSVFEGLRLPHLKALLVNLQDKHTERDGDTNPSHMPHERVHARALGWDTSNAQAELPWAAHENARHPITTALATSPESKALPQAWMTPCHWQIGMDQVVMTDPEHLHLSSNESQQLLQAMQQFLQEDGLQVTWRSPLLWHAQGPLLANLPTASLDRVIGQNVKDWMPQHPAARPLQRLQSEMQMLLYNHPVNDARDARRQHTVNAFWLHGAGVLPPDTPNPTVVVTTPALRASALHGNAQAWQQAWQQLDASAVADLLRHVKATGQGTLSLCSEHTAHTYTAAPTAWHQHITRVFNKTSPVAALQALVLP